MFEMVEKYYIQFKVHANGFEIGQLQSSGLIFQYCSTSSIAEHVQNIEHISQINFSVVLFHGFKNYVTDFFKILRGFLWKYYKNFSSTSLDSYRNFTRNFCNFFRRILPSISLSISSGIPSMFPLRTSPRIFCQKLLR